ncbi:hypothetical protein JMN32_21040 [Fulvivirga sp. 29W222]|uniref:Cyclic nucleotide-binding domain-containing protein n=1 Tax=Fulvivirga marina TaxID=2494733 RepID=A0A937G5I9_9BACT|nr:hypothetical protein [Fulvivirga marina]MBL6448811.1 hypothetical protein [Fulvivirga marina]
MKSLNHQAFNTKRKFSILATLGIFIGIGLAFLDLAAVSLFLNKYDSQDLPSAFAMSGLVGVIVLGIYAYQKNRFSFSRVAIISFTLITLSTFFIYYGLENIDYYKYVYWLFVLTGPINALVYYNFRSLGSLIFAQQRHKKLSEWTHIGVIIGAATIFFTITPLRKQLALSISEFVYFAGLAFAFSSLLLALISRSSVVLKELAVSAQYINAKNSYFKISKNNFLVQLALFSLTVTVILLFVDYYFLHIVEASYSSTNELLDFLGFFYGCILIAGIFTHILIYNRVMNKYGLKVALLVLPIIVGLLSGLGIVIGSYFGHVPGTNTFHVFFLTICILKLIGTSVNDNLTANAFRYYFLPIEDLLRQDTLLKITGVIREASVAIAGGILLYMTTATFIDNDAYFAAALIIICIVCIIIVFKIYNTYRDVLKNTLDKQQLVKTSEARLSYAEKLARETKNIPLARLPRHLNIINTLDPVVFKSAVLSIINSDNDKAQKIALHQASHLCLLEAIPILDEIMESKYFNVLKNRDLIEKTYHKLRGAEFRLEKLTYIEQLTYSKLVNERIFGASLTRYAEEDIKPKLLNKLFRDPVTKVRYYAAAAAAGSEDESMLKNLIVMLDNPLYSNAAVAAISATGEQTLPVLESAFHLTGQSEKIQLRIVQIYGRIGSQQAVELLLKKLDLPNQNVIAATLVALSKSGYNVKKDKALNIKRELEEICATTISNMQAYLDLQKEKASNLLLNAVTAEIENNYNTIFQLLALLYEAKSVDLVKENINSGNTDQSDFASELLDIFLEEELKPIVLPILNVSSYSEKINKLQYILPTTSMSKNEVLYDLILKDYKKINRWTKACAIMELAEENSPSNHDIFAANLVNPDQMLREIAAAAYYRLSQENFAVFIERDKYKKEYAEQALKLIEDVEKGKEGELQESPKLNIEVVKFLNDIAGLQSVPGLVLSEIAKLTKAAFYPIGTEVVSFNGMDDMAYAFIYKGSVSLQKNGLELNSYDQNGFLHDLDLINEGEAEYNLIANENTILFWIDRSAFSELCSFYEVLPDNLLNELNDKKKEVMAV